MGSRASTIVLAAWLVVACHGADGPAVAAESSSSGAPESSGTSESGDGIAAEHGVVEIELARPEDEGADPLVYSGTAQIVATLQYRECLAAFYDAHPELRQAGPDGALVFGGAALGGEGWLDRLCMPGEGFVDCEIVSIQQELDVVAQLTIVYAVPEQDLAGLRLRFGPLPTMATAMCGVGETASVRVGGGDAVQATDGAGAMAWHAASYSPAEAVTDEGPIIRVTPEG